MRYLGILALTVSLSSPALARKHHAAARKPQAARKHQAAPRALPAPPPVVAEAEPPPRAQPPPRAAANAQENDDEVPGQKHKK